MIRNHSTQARLAKDEILNWIKQYQDAPNEEVKTKLVLHFEELVRKLAIKLARHPSGQEDLYQVGMVGLLAAFSRFDSSYGRSFESFAVPTIVGEMKRYLRDKTWSVHVPRRIKELGPRIRKATEELTATLQRSPKIEEIAQYLQVSEEEVLETLEMSRSYQSLSMDSQLDVDSEGSQLTLMDTVGKPDQGYQAIQYKLTIEKLFEALDEREKEVLRLTYIEGLSQQETGVRLGISQMHVSRLQRRAIKKIKEVYRYEIEDPLV